jgi:hypothetical protein
VYHILIYDTQDKVRKIDSRKRENLLNAKY